MNSESNPTIALLPKQTDTPRPSYFKKLIKVLGYTPSELDELRDDEENNKSWFPESKAQTCYKCCKNFSTLFLRKHHCRICGNIFCKDCSQNMVEGKYWGCSKLIKVCEHCYQMCQKLDETLVDTIIHNKSNLKEDINSINDNINNLKRETKLSDYCKKAKKDLEEANKYLAFKDKKYEESLKQSIEANYDLLVRNCVESVLKCEMGGLCYDKWNDKLVELIKKSISMVNPSFRDLRDSLDITDYIKIKTIEYKDRSLSRVIDGYAMSKNVCSKKMRTSIENPSILLLDCGLDCNRVSPNNCDKFFTIEPAYLEIIKKKIELVDVDLILISKDIAQRLQSELSKKISLVLNVKSESLKKIARCTKTYSLPSIDLLDKQTILGHCKKFKIEKISIKEPICSFNDIIKTNERNLMIFEGCDNVLHSTIILSGPDKYELKILKRLLKDTILITVRDLFLQKFLLYYSYSEPHSQPQKSVGLEVPIELQRTSSVSIMRSFSGNNESNVLSNIICEHSGFGGVKKRSYNDEHPSFRFGFDDQLLNKNASSLFFVKVTITSGIDKEQNFNPTEAEVQKMINFSSHEPEDVKLVYYSKDPKFDKPLGRLIIDICNEGLIKCSQCKKNNSNHIYHLYFQTGRISIQLMKKMSDDQLETAMEYINHETNNDLAKYTLFPKGEKTHNDKVDYGIDIYMYGYCKKCNKIVTPLARLPKEFFNYSVARYFKHFVYNHEVKNRNDKKQYNIFPLSPSDCAHSSFNDISRIFITKIGTIKFAYAPISKFKIDSGVFLERKEPITERVLERNITLSKERSKEVIKYLIINYAAALDELNKFEKKQDKESTPMKNIFISINKLKAIIGSHYTSLQEFRSFIDKLLSLPAKFEDEVKSQVYINKIYLRVVQFKIVNNMIRKIIQQMKNYSSIVLSLSALATTTSRESFMFTPAFSFLENSNNISQMEDSSLLRKLTNDCCVDLNTFAASLTSSYINIDTKENYKYILEAISFFDESHSKIANHIKENDFSSIIAYALTSDQYQSFILSKNQFDLVHLHCERKLIEIGQKEEETGWLRLEQCLNSETNSTQHANKQTSDMYNYLLLQNESSLCDTSLLFDSRRTSYFNTPLDKQKTLQQLETELLSDEKQAYVFKTQTIDIQNKCSMPIEIHYSCKTKSENFNPLSISALPLMRKQSFAVSFTSVLLQEMKEKRPMLPNEESIPKNNLTNVSIVEEFDFVGTDIKKTLDEIGGIEGEIEEMINKRLDGLAEMKSKFELLRLTFIEDSLDNKELEVIAYYPRQFESLRITYCATYEEFILSVAKSNLWSNCTGGKSKADFFKSNDNKFILKCLNKHEFVMFLESAFQYFHHNAKYLHHKMPSSLAKTLGAYRIKIKSKSNHVENYYVVLMENLFYGIDIEKSTIKAYDLKGSTINRYIAKNQMKKQQVLPDTNFKEDQNGEPIILDRSMSELLFAAVHNDSLILSKLNVVDYSLMVIINEIDKTIRFGIIDYIRKYTWDKQLEQVGKTIINGLNSPTIVSPNNYRERFQKAIANYFIGI